jgi:hypothetical protein
MSIESQRLTEQVFRFVDGHKQEVVDWLVKLGCTVTVPGDSLTAPVLRGPTGITGGLGGDPMALAATMAMLLWDEPYEVIMEEFDEWLERQEY